MLHYGGLVAVVIMPEFLAFWVHTRAHCSDSCKSMMHGIYRISALALAEQKLQLCPYERGVVGFTNTLHFENV